MTYEWRLTQSASDKVEALSRELELDGLTCRLLVNRGVESPEAAQQFLNPSLDSLHDPLLMKGMESALSRLFQAIEHKEEILVYGDYDVDGITATVVLKRALEMLGARVRYYIPRRLEEGYGLKKEIIEKAHRRGCRLIITVDSGIRAVEVCERARELGLDIIITDHHLPGPTLPRAFCILNPKQPGCKYPFKELAAVGVVLKLVHALFREVGRQEVLPHFLKVVAIGTVADMVPLTGENRIMVKHGLEKLARPYNLGLQALLNGSGIGARVNHTDVGFKLAPRINAFTRMGGGGPVVDLFSVDDPAEASAIVRDMNEKNLRRRQEESLILEEIEQRLLQEPEAVQKKFLLIWGQDWHRGVIGNVASRLVEKFYRPVLVISVGEGKCQGSGRSIPGFHLLQALDCCPEAFSTYGGHAQAVGCTLSETFSRPERIHELEKRLNEYASAHLPTEALVPWLRIDAYLGGDQLSPGLCQELERLSPFGIGNPVPLFASRDLKVAGGPWILKEQHLKFQVRCGELNIDAIWWRRGENAGHVSAGGQVDLVYSLSLESYRGQTQPLLTIKDLRPPPASI